MGVDLPSEFEQDWLPEPELRAIAMANETIRDSKK
jgi:hypothetical protein